MNLKKMANFQSDNFKEQVGFAIGTGRCGTNFIAKIMQQEQGIASVHERNALNATFHRYCKWYNLPVDHEGFLQTKENEIKQDLENNRFSFEASAHLSLSVQELYDRFKAKFLLLVRSPERVVNSYLQKKWYEQSVIRADPNLAPGYQEYCESFHHSLGRIMPSGEKFLQWNQMSRIGKLAWYWNALNTQVLEQFEGIPETHWRIEKLEDLSYSRYLEIAQFFGFESIIAQETYEALALRRPNAKASIPTIATWTPVEIDEFEAEIQPMAKRLNYEYQVSHLPIPVPRSKPTSTTQINQLASTALKKLGQTLRLNSNQEKQN
jgi:hypothetical protein